MLALNLESFRMLQKLFRPILGALLHKVHGLTDITSSRAPVGAKTDFKINVKELFYKPCMITSSEVKTIYIFKSFSGQLFGASDTFI